MCRISRRSSLCSRCVRLTCASKSGARDPSRFSTHLPFSAVLVGGHRISTLGGGPGARRVVLSRRTLDTRRRSRRSPWCRCCAPHRVVCDLHNAASARLLVAAVASPPRLSCSVRVSLGDDGSSSLILSLICLAEWCRAFTPLSPNCLRWTRIAAPCALTATRSAGTRRGSLSGTQCASPTPP